MDKILISIIVPIYNTDKYLNRCIDSIINQSIENFEIILINDGSTDNSINICEQYANEYKNIKLINQENKGQAAARNLGIKESRGKYIGFVDSDDYIDINMYSCLIDLAEKYNCDIVSSKYRTVCSFENEKCSLINVDDFFIESDRKIILEKYMLQQITASPCDKVFKRKLLIGNKILFPEGRYYEDITMILKSLNLAKNVLITNAQLYNYCLREESTTTITDEKKYNDLRLQLIDFYSYIKFHYIEEINDLSSAINTMKFIHTNMILKMMKYLHRYNEVNKYFEALPNNIIIFGASSGGELIKYFCKINNKNVIYFCDNDENKWGKFLDNVEVISPNVLIKLNYDDTKIYIASTYYKQIYEQLLKCGLEDKIVNLNII